MFLKLDVTHPEENFEAEYDPELRSVYSHSVHAADLLWCLKYPAMIQDDAFRDELLRMSAVVTVPEDYAHPTDLLGKAMERKCRAVACNAENFPEPGENLGFADVVKTADESDLHVDNDGVVVTRAFRAAHTLTAIARNAQEQAAIERQSDRETLDRINGVTNGHMFAKAPEEADFSWFQAHQGCILALPCVGIADGVPGTHHARPMIFEPRLLTRAFLNRGNELCVTNVTPVEHSALRDRAIARAHLPQRRLVAA